jgi:iron complex outermembrane receptor protein
MAQFLLFLPIATLLLAPVASAAEQPLSAVAASTTLDTVQVQAARVRAVDTIDLPASVSIIPAQGNTRGASVAEVLTGVPGLLARDRQNFAQDTQLSVRGFGARSTFGVRGVRLLLDGVPATMPDGQGQLSHFGLIGADRIEVMRGPFSALYGNSSGGVLQLWSADGQSGDPWRLRSVYGSDNSLSTGMQLQGAQGEMDYNLAANRFRTDGWRQHSAARRDVAMAKLGWTPAPGQRLELLANYFNSPDTQDPLGLDSSQVRQDRRQATAVARLYNTRKSVEQSQLGAVFTASGEQQTLRLMGYGGQRAVQQFLAIPAATQANRLHGGGVIELDSDYGGVDARWRWSGQWAGRPAEITIGANADQQLQHRTGYENFVGSTLGVKGGLRRDQRDRVRNVDQFAQAWWQWHPRWSLLAGLRHSQVQFRSVDNYLAPGNPDDSGRRDYAATTPVAGIVFRPTEKLRLYVSSGRGFETPTFNELGYRADGGAGLALELQPARTHSYELGAKWQSQHGAELEAALFRADTDDELAVARNSGGRASYRNIGQTRRQGAEASYRWPIGDNAQLQLAWTWLEATVRQGYLSCVAAGCTVPNTSVAAGSRLPGVPQQQGFARWQWQPRQWQLAAELVGASDTVANDLANARAPGYTLLNLELSRQWGTATGPLRLFARIDNALDQRWIGSVIVNDGNQRFYEPGHDRRYSVGLEWQWQR